MQLWGMVFTGRGVVASVFSLVSLFMSLVFMGEKPDLWLEPIWAVVVLSFVMVPQFFQIPGTYSQSDWRYHAGQFWQYFVNVVIAVHLLYFGWCLLIPLFGYRLQFLSDHSFQYSQNAFQLYHAPYVIKASLEGFALIGLIMLWCLGRNPPSRQNP